MDILTSLGVATLHQFGGNSTDFALAKAMFLQCHLTANLLLVGSKVVFSFDVEQQLVGMEL